MTLSGKRILCLGDSNTFGYDPASGFGGRYPQEVRWTGRLGAAGWEIVNRGMNGSTVPSGAQIPAFADMIRAHQPLAAVTVMFGTNDVLQGGSAQAAGRQMAQFLRGVGEHPGGAVCVLLSPPPLRPGAWVPSAELIRVSEQLAPVYESVAAECGALFADAGRWGIPLAHDGVHFTPEGHAVFSARLGEILQGACQTL